MNREQLKAFCVVAKTLSFTEAAKILLISQPAVSRQIAALEDEIGAELFKRGHNTLTLTRAGEMMYEELPKRLSNLEKIFFNAKLIDQGKLRRIKIGVLRDQCPDKQFLDVCRSMRLDNYYVRIQQYDFLELENAVIQKDVDVAVSIQWVASAFDECEKLIYTKEPLCLVVNSEFSPEVPKEINRDTLMEFSIERPTMIPGTDFFPKRHFREAAEMISSFWSGITEEDIDVVIPMVQAGIGSALVNASHILSCDSTVRFYPLEFLDMVNKGVFWMKDNPNDAVKDFVKRIDNWERLKS